MPVVINKSINDLIGKMVYRDREDYHIHYCSDGCLLKTVGENSKVVKNGQTETTFFAVLDNDFLFLPIQTKPREKTHPLGQQNNTLNHYQIWHKIKEASHPNLMDVIEVCQCTAKVKIVQGRPLLNIGTMPAWQQINNNTDSGVLFSEKVPFELWKTWMSGLNAGLLSLHKSGLSHGDPYPFNIIINNNQAIWVDYSHSTDDTAYFLKDVYTFIFFTCLYSLQFCDRVSPSLIEDIIAALNDRDANEALLNLEKVFDKVRKDLIENEDDLSNGLILDNLTSLNVVDEFFYRGTITYYQSFISWMKSAIYLKNLNDITKFSFQMKEKEMRRLMVPKGELEAVKDNFSLKINELNSVIDNLNADINNLLLEKKRDTETLKEEKLVLQEKIKKYEDNIKKLEEQEQLWNTKIVEICQDLLLAQQLKSHKVSRLTRIMKHEVKRNGFRGLLKVLKKTTAFINGKRGYFTEYNEIDPIYQIASKAQSLSNKLVSVSGFANVEIPTDKIAEPRKVQFKSSNGKKRVAYFTNQLLDWFDQRPRYGGGERYCINLANLMVENGLEVDIYQIAPTEFEGEYYGFHVKALKHGEFYSEFNIDAANQFYEISLDYDHVIYNMPELSAGKMRPDAISITHGIWFDHNNYGPAFKFREKEWFQYLYKAYDNPQRIVSVDTNSINVIRALWPELATKMKYIPNFVDHSRFNPPDRRDNKKIKILFPRRSQINRGSRILEDILRNVPYDVEFYWVGEGDPYDTELIKSLTKKDPRLHYEKDADFDEMPKWYQECDIAVIPTIACEGTSLSCIEALASGCATICTNVGGLTDIIQDQYNGRCVDPNPLEIAKAINEMIENPELMKMYQQVGLQSSYAFSLERWRDLWKEVLIQEGWIEQKKNDINSNGVITSNDCRNRDVNVAIVTRNAYHGGVESLIKIEQDRLNATVFVTGGLNDPEGTCPFTYKYIESYGKLVEALQHYDAVIYHWPYDWAVKAIRDSGVPSIEFVHRIDTSECDKSVPTKVVTHSDYIADYLKKEFGIGVSVIPNVVDTIRFKPSQNKVRSNTIGLITSYYKTKGIDIFLNAWSRIRDKYPDVTVKIYGKGDELEEFKKLASNLNIAGDVEFLGPTSTPELILQDFDVYVTASRIEGLPIAVLEALACNIPVIASDIEGHKIINDLAEKNGLTKPILLFESENIESLAQKLEDFLSGKITYKDYSGPELINQLFSPNYHIEKLMANLKEIIDQRKPKRILTEIDVSINKDTKKRIDHSQNAFYKKRVLQDGEVKIIFDSDDLISSYNEFVCYRYFMPPNCKLITFTVETSADSSSNIFLQYDIISEEKLIKAEGSSRFVGQGNNSICTVIDVNEKADIIDFIMRPNPGEKIKINKVSIASFA